jgi:hypothetical protein
MPSFSVEGREAQKKALIEDALRKYGLSLDRGFAASYGDVFKYGRSFDHCIVGEEGSRILIMGGRQSTAFVLPQDYEKALNAIGWFFGHHTTGEPPTEPEGQFSPELSSLISKLKSSDEKLRIAAAQGLASLGAGAFEALPILNEAYKRERALFAARAIIDASYTIRDASRKAGFDLPEPPSL